MKETAGGRVFALRFRAYGQRRYLTLGTDEDGWNVARARTELENVLADVRRGIWRPPTPPATPELHADPTFHEFASQWVERHRREWRENTLLDYTWQLSSHLLPFFHRHTLRQITIAEVDRYRDSKLREGRISAVSINKTITRLAQILQVATEYGYIDQNPAIGRRRRLRVTRPAPVWLDRAEQIEALLTAASELDVEARGQGYPSARRPILATLVFAGLRIGELTGLRWRDVDLAGNRIFVRESKTGAGVRMIDLLPALRDELAEYKASIRLLAPDDPVFATASGRALDVSNLHKRVFAKSVERANEALARRGDVPLPEGLTPHKLRHTFASLLVALGVDPGAVMDQLGHADAGFTLRVYRHAMRRTPAARAAFVDLVGAPNWALSGTGGALGIDQLLGGDVPTDPEAGSERAFPAKPERGLEPLTYRLQGDC
ncbi:MAG TPA: tyrosine-type recombinase/integrase [Solirubrobacteraceae bacterium]|nr:tyrosine-type recombinase/integrase [Solirubrobacteraceae bacterium]